MDSDTRKVLARMLSRGITETEVTSMLHTQRQHGRMVNLDIDGNGYMVIPDSERQECCQLVRYPDRVYPYTHVHHSNSAIHCLYVVRSVARTIGSADTVEIPDSDTRTA